ncbi:MAG: 50S ribosomal protein L3 N(5)-glutamine methyltransferase [Halioglobus sp.]|nr:50S ribosomal protein L3 N(5)-glutamine methyltransferase [Halioglobus sp.]
MASSMKPPRTLGEALNYCHDALVAGDVYYGHGTDNAWDESVQLVLSLAALPLDTDRGSLGDPLPADFLPRLDALLIRRVRDRVPAAYLTGRAWFAGLEFLCDERALVPRSPLAELIERDFQPWYAGPEPQRILDLCCGGGCIGLAAASYNPQARVDLLDIDPDALGLARANAEHLGLADRVAVVASDLLEAADPAGYDLILSNPPYVDAPDLAAMPQEYHHEPSVALGSGADGLDITRRILARAGRYLRPHGHLILEVGNSWRALEHAYPSVPFTWIEFERGGEGVFTLSATEWQDYRASLGS